MKKVKFLLVGTIAIFGMAAFLVSCDKGDSDSTCVCRSSHGLTRTIDPASFGASNCSDLEIVMEAQASDGITYSCS